MDLPHSLQIKSKSTMQGGKTSRAAVVVCIFVLMAGSLGEPADNMEVMPTATHKKPIRHSHSLSAGEQEYIQKRKQVVLESLSRMGTNCTADSVPHIALLGSGGGQRAAVALIGSLYQLREEGLLDILLYMGGVSGSTWSMSSLYSDPTWSTNMDRAVSRLSGPGVSMEEVMAWLSKRAEEEYFSLTDIWGVITSAGVMKQMDLRHLSDEASRNVSNPYPVYCAIEKYCYSHGPIEGQWFEVTPHEAGFTELDLFIETSHLGSRFQRGELLEQRPEMDMVKLQGVLGCAVAHEDTVRELMPPWLNVPGPGLMDSAADQYLHVYHTLVHLVALIRNTIEDPTALSHLDNLQKTLQDKLQHNDSAFLESKSSEERKHLFQRWSLEQLSAVETWSHSLEDGPFKTHVSWLSQHALPLVVKWEWGTIANFLYQYPDSAVPPCLHSAERFQLIDAGLLINVPYPSFLGDKRDIDLIIAPEYSAGNIFETLTFARDYAAEVKKPFPKIDDKILEEKDWPKDCYVFQGEQNQLTIVYMPLFNRNNCKDAEEVRQKMEEFSTFQLPFSEEKIHFVLETAKANMKNNKDTILREINKAAVRRQRKKKSADSGL